MNACQWLPFRAHAVVLAALLALTGSIVAPAPGVAEEIDPSIAACLKSFGEHPFGANPSYRTLTVAVKVFGIGQDTVDKEITSGPALVYVQPGVNVMGGSVIQLSNPQGWYCMRSSVNVMGGLDIKLACNARFAMVAQDMTVMAGGSENKGITVMGNTTVSRDCP